MDDYSKFDPRAFWFTCTPEKIRRLREDDLATLIIYSVESTVGYGNADAVFQDLAGILYEKCHPDSVYGKQSSEAGDKPEVSDLVEIPGSVTMTSSMLEFEKQKYEQDRQDKLAREKREEERLEADKQERLAKEEKQFKIEMQFRETERQDRLRGEEIDREREDRKHEIERQDWLRKGEQDQLREDRKLEMERQFWETERRDRLKLSDRDRGDRLEKEKIEYDRSKCDPISDLGTSQPFSRNGIECRSADQGKYESPGLSPRSVYFVNSPPVKVIPDSEIPVRPVFTQFGLGDSAKLAKNVVKGRVASLKTKSKGTNVSLLADTGSTQSVIVKGVIPLGPCVGKVALQGVMGNPKILPLHRVHLDCEYYTGEVTVGVLKSIPCTGIKLLLGRDVEWKTEKGSGGKKSKESQTSEPVVCPKPVVATAIEPSVRVVSTSDNERMSSARNVAVVTRSNLDTRTVEKQDDVNKVVDFQENNSPLNDCETQTPTYAVSDLIVAPETNVETDNTAARAMIETGDATRGNPEVESVVKIKVDTKTNVESLVDKKVLRELDRLDQLCDGFARDGAVMVSCVSDR